MARQTPLLLPPTLDEVKQRAVEIKLPEKEAEKFFYFQETRGWKIAGERIKCWKSALSYWRCCWLDREHPEGKASFPKPNGVSRDFNAKLESTVNQLKNRK